MNNVLSSECHLYLTTIEPYFTSVLTRYGFILQNCDCQRAGRECVAMYETKHQRLLLHLSDGDFAVLLGSSEAAFPGPYDIDRSGADGWYAVFLLVEFQSGRRVWTQKRINRFQRGELDQYSFEADLFAEWADRLLPLFAPGHDPAWQAAFQQRFNQR